MNNKTQTEYWQNRFQQLEKSQHNESILAYQEIQKQFDKSQRAIESKINSWYGRYASNNGISIEEARKQLNAGELKELKWDVQEYIKHGKENAANGKWMKELENASAKAHISRLEAIKLQTQMECEKLMGGVTDDIDEHIRNTFKDTYYHSAYEIARGTGVGATLSSINDDKLSKIINKPWAVDEKNFATRLGESKVKLINNIHNSLTQMCLNGENPSKAIDQLARTMNGNKARAGRIIMTESAYFNQAAQKQCFEDLDVEEFEIVATLDGDTCGETCQGQDGEHYPMKIFEPGVTAPPFHPNCRCCTCPYFNDEWSNSGERAARDEEGNTYYVPTNTTYEDWKSAFVDGKAPTKFEKTVSGGTIKERITAIKNEANGSITDEHLQKAGSIVRQELMGDRADLKNAYEEAQQKVKSFNVEGLKEKRKTLGNVKRELLSPEEVGMKSIDEVIEEYNKIDAEIKRIVSSAEYKTATYDTTIAQDKYKKSQSDNIEELKAKLSEIRSVGYTDVKPVSKHLNNSRSPMRKIVERAYDCYPTTWIDSSINRNTLSVKKVDRGYYSNRSEEIAISGFMEDSQMETAIHELGHRFEDVISEIFDSEKMFYNRRTKGEDLVWLGHPYSKSEKTRKDNFLDAYMGKEYDDAYELVSMGFQYAYTDPTRLWEDEDFANFIYGILALI